MNKKIKSELKILEYFKSPRLKEKYKKIVNKQISLLVDHSFTGGNRLNQIWKNTYLLMRARMYYCQYKIYKRSKTAKQIENELIEKTLEVITTHKNNLKLYISEYTTTHWDNMAKKYADLGGLKGKTKRSVGKITQEKDYLVFNATLEAFSQYLLKDSKEFKKLQIDKLNQYKYLSLIEVFLQNLKDNKNFVCDLSKEVAIKH